MNILENTPQGSAVWLAIRAQYDTASEAPAASGASKYQSRADLLKQKATSLTPEVGPAKQAIFNRGHESEAGARGLAESIIGGELFPVTATLRIDGLDLLASMDGATMDETIIWEHKLFSEKLAADVRASTLDPHYTLQLDQQLLVSGARKCLFMTSDGTENNMAWCWYESSPEKFSALIAMWKQFRADLAAYVPVEVINKPTGKTMEALPALRVEVTGMVTASNLAAYKEHAIAVFAGINRELTTDQHFADAAKTVKWCEDVEGRLVAAKQHALSQTETIDALFRTIDEISAEARQIRLDLDKLVDKRKAEIKLAVIKKAREAYDAHIAELIKETGGPWIVLQAPNFAESAKNKRTVASLQDAIDTALAGGKIAADASAKSIRASLACLKEDGAGYESLFADRLSLIGKPLDDLKLLIKSRIDEQKAKSQKLIDDAAAKVAAELATAKASPEGAELSPAAQALNEQQGDELFDRFHPSTVRVVPIRCAAPAAPTTPPSLKLGQIGERLGFAVTAEFLKNLGFEPAARDKSALLFHESVFPLICMRLVAHIQGVQARQAA